MLSEWMDGWKKLAEQQQAMFADQTATAQAAMQQWMDTAQSAKPVTGLPGSMSAWRWPTGWTLPTEWALPDMRWSLADWSPASWATMDWHKAGLDSLQAYPFAQLMDPAHVDGREEADWNRVMQTMLGLFFWPMWMFSGLMPAASDAPAAAAQARTVAKPKAPAPKVAKKPAPEAASQASPEQAFHSATAEPVLLDAPRGTADDLLVIKGIGPKINGILNSLGIYHYAQIAAWTPAQMDWVEEKLDFKGRIGREDWIAQARKLMTH